MKRIFLLTVLAVFILGIFQGNLYSLISSRIEGIVLDADTGIPIKGAELILYQFSVKINAKIFDFKTISDGNGKFVFDSEKVEYLISPNFYYLVQCKHKNFVDLYPDVPEDIGEYLKDKVFNIFALKEGEIKFLKIKLDKGGSIEGNVKYNDGTGLKPLKNYSFELIRELNPYGIPDAIRGPYKYAQITTDENGNFLKSGIPPNSGYYFGYIFNGYPIKYSKNFSVIKGVKIRIDEIIDLSDKTGVRGTVTINGKVPNNGVELSMFLENRKDSKNSFCNFSSELNHYFCLNLKPGKYNLTIIALHNLDVYKKKVIIKLKNNKIVIYNIDFTIKEKI